jgi:hypothetical protein
MILIEKCLEMGATKDSIITPGSGESRLIMAWLQIRQAAVPGIFTRTLEISSTLHKESPPFFLWPRFCQIAPNKKKARH